MRAGVVVLVLVGAVACGNPAESVSIEPAPATAPPSPAICVLDADLTGQQCGLSETELRSLNLRYADRMPFAGDVRRLARAVTRVKHALAAVDTPSVPRLVTALTSAGFAERQIVTSDNAVRTAGLAYAVELTDGCIFGSFTNGRFTVQSGGWVRDGGCLASYGH